MAPAIGVALETYEIRREGIPRVWSGLLRDVREIPAQRAAPAPQECPLSRVGYVAVGEVMPRDHRQLEVVVHHPVVLARRLQVAQQGAVAGLQKLGCILANRLATERLFVAHFAIGRELGERG